MKLKKILAAFLAAALCVSLASCSGDIRCGIFHRRIHR